MKKLVALLLILVLLLCSFAEVFAANTAKAADMKLDSTTGTVTVKKSSGAGITVRDNMKLYSGYTVKTGKASYAYISLDSAKVIKMDASTEVEIRASGKKLEVYLKTGELFFDVTEKLKGDESLNIRTNTMVTGIRGTFGSQKEDELTIYNGEAVVTAVNTNNSALVTGKKKSVVVKSCEKAIGEKLLEKTELQVVDLKLEDVSPFAIVTMDEVPERTEIFISNMLVKITDPTETDEDAFKEEVEKKRENSRITLATRDEEGKKEAAKTLGNGKWFTEDTGKTPNDGQLIGSAGKDNETVFNEPMTPPAEYIPTTYTIRLPQNISLAGDSGTNYIVRFYTKDGEQPVDIPGNVLTVPQGSEVTLYFFFTSDYGAIEAALDSNDNGFEESGPGEYRYTFTPTQNETFKLEMGLFSDDLALLIQDILSDPLVTNLKVDVDADLLPVTVNAGQTFTVQGNLNLAGNLTNNGMIFIEGGQITVPAGVSLQNGNGGTIDIDADGVLSITGATPTETTPGSVTNNNAIDNGGTISDYGTFVNNGTIRMTDPDHSNLVVGNGDIGSGTLTNNGTIDNTILGTIVIANPANFSGNAIQQ